MEDMLGAVRSPVQVRVRSDKEPLKRKPLMDGALDDSVNMRRHHAPPADSCAQQCEAASFHAISDYVERRDGGHARLGDPRRLGASRARTLERL